MKKSIWKLFSLLWTFQFTRKSFFPPTLLSSLWVATLTEQIPLHGKFILFYLILLIIFLASVAWMVGFECGNLFDANENLIIKKQTFIHNIHCFVCWSMKNEENEENWGKMGKVFPFVVGVFHFVFIGRVAGYQIPSFMRIWWENFQRAFPVFHLFEKIF